MVICPQNARDTPSTVIHYKISRTHSFRVRVKKGYKLRPRGLNKLPQDSFEEEIARKHMRKAIHTMKEQMRFFPGHGHHHSYDFNVSHWSALSQKLA
jgi:hypothetical protein